MLPAPSMHLECITQKASALSLLKGMAVTSALRTAVSRSGLLGLKPCSALGRCRLQHVNRVRKLKDHSQASCENQDFNLVP